MWKHPRIFPVYWGLIALLILTADFFTGPHIAFPILFLLTVIPATWYSGPRWGGLYAVLMPLIRCGFEVHWTLPSPNVGVSILNGTVSAIVLLVLSFLIHTVRTQERALEREVSILEGLLPICSFCKRIRNPDGRWEQLEGYISSRSEAQFSHSICPECGKEHYPEMDIEW